MAGLWQKVTDLIKKTNFVKKLNFDKFLFCFLYAIKTESKQFKINIDSKCLVLSQYPGAEIKGLGGLIAQYPKNFEVLCFTNGSDLAGSNPMESANIKKQQFTDIMKETRVKGYKIFDIDSKTLKNHYSTFKKIDISEVDYIFVPNIYDSNVDTIAILKHFKQILNDKEIKPDLKILMYESDFSLCTYDYHTDISHIVETKKKLLKTYYSEDKYPELTNKIMGINAFRAIKLNCDYAEVFMGFSVEDFLKIPLI